MQMVDSGMGFGSGASVLNANISSVHYAFQAELKVCFIIHDFANTCEGIIKKDIWTRMS